MVQSQSLFALRMLPKVDRSHCARGCPELPSPMGPRGSALALSWGYGPTGAMGPQGMLLGPAGPMGPTSPLLVRPAGRITDPMGPTGPINCFPAPPDQRVTSAPGRPGDAGATGATGHLRLIQFRLLRLQEQRNASIRQIIALSK